ncbi:DUF952 domain-containing protein [Fulvimarina sp. MAC3]|uniref:DUF952 domain-containing protein n=1 Tax=Fulvimarina sp. MAC3 TaxID=3148887 RepID=UPI0031FC45EA
MSDPIYKILTHDEWASLQAAGRFDGAPVDIADGYVHFSTASQVRETAAKHFAGKNDLHLLAVAPEQLGDALNWEPSRGGALFPHLYAPLSMDAVIWEKPLPLDDDGRHVFPEDLAGATA